MTIARFGGSKINVKVGGNTVCPPCPPAEPVSIQNQDGQTIAEVDPGGTYSVIELTKIRDTGGPYSPLFIIADPL